MAGRPAPLKQAETARKLGYHFGIASMAAFRGMMEQEMIHHMRELAKVMPMFGFYLLTGVGGIKLPYSFWRELVEIENVVGIKIAPFDRYGTVDVARALADAGRENEITLYTGNDDSIVYDFITPFRFGPQDNARTVRIRGGLLGQWACWTQRAVELHERLLRVADGGGADHGRRLLTLSAQITDANAALFDPQHRFAGSIPGVNEILRRQGLLEGTWTLKRGEVLSPGQSEEIDRVCAAYPHLTDDAFVAANLDRWLDSMSSRSPPSKTNRGPDHFSRRGASRGFPVHADARPGGGLRETRRRHPRARRRGQGRSHPGDDGQARRPGEARHRRRALFRCGCEAAP